MTAPGSALTRPRIAYALAPAGVYLAVRAVGVTVLALMAGPARLVPELTSWDAAWLLTIAEHGYVMENGRIVLSHERDVEQLTSALA